MAGIPLPGVLIPKLLKVYENEQKKKAKRLLKEVQRLAWREKDTGKLAGSYKIKKTKKGKYEVVSELDYAETVEKGRRPGAKRPPTYALWGWAMRKGMLTGDMQKDKGTLYVLARAIGRDGVPGKYFIKRAKKHLRMK